MFAKTFFNQENFSPPRNAKSLFFFFSFCLAREEQRRKEKQSKEKQSVRGQADLPKYINKYIHILYGREKEGELRRKM